MQSLFTPKTGTITETIRGIVDRVTYHNPDSGWSVLRVFPFNSPLGSTVIGKRVSEYDDKSAGYD
jgi:hypothetical protein